MPLYTYIITFNNSNYVSQGNHSNFRGFINSWCTDLPENALKGFDSNTKKTLTRKAYSVDFEPVPNRKNVWHKSIDLDGKNFSVHAIETTPK